MRRADAIHFAVAIFTNLTQRLRDFHPMVGADFEAKPVLFVPDPPGAAIVNLDDPYGKCLVDELEHPVTYAVRTDADSRATDNRTDIAGSAFTVQTSTTSTLSTPAGPSSACKPTWSATACSRARRRSPMGSSTECSSGELASTGKGFGPER